MLRAVWTLRLAISALPGLITARVPVFGVRQVPDLPAGVHARARAEAFSMAMASSSLRSPPTWRAM